LPFPLTKTGENPAKSFPTSMDIEGETFELDSSGEVREYVRPGGVQGEIGFELEMSKFGLYVEVEAVALLLLKLSKLPSKLEWEEEEEEEEGPEAGLRFWFKFE
jgi:hypothetical protein